MSLDDQLQVLVAVGAAAAADCQDCLRRLRERAITLNIEAERMTEAVQLGLRVSRAARDKTEKFAASTFSAVDMSSADLPGVDTVSRGCCA